MPAMVLPLCRTQRSRNEMIRPVTVVNSVVRVAFDIPSNSNHPMWSKRMCHDHLSNVVFGNFRCVVSDLVAIALPVTVDRLKSSCISLVQSMYSLWYSLYMSVAYLKLMDFYFPAVNPHSSMDTLNLMCHYSRVLSNLDLNWNSSVAVDANSDVNGRFVLIWVALDSRILARYSDNYQPRSPMNHISTQHDCTPRPLNSATMNLK